MRSIRNEWKCSWRERGVEKAFVSATWCFHKTDREREQQIRSPPSKSKLAWLIKCPNKEVNWKQQLWLSDHSFASECYIKASHLIHLKQPSLFLFITVLLKKISVLFAIVTYIHVVLYNDVCKSTLFSRLHPAELDNSVCMGYSCSPECITLITSCNHSLIRQLQTKKVFMS